MPKVLDQFELVETRGRHFKHSWEGIAEGNLKTTLSYFISFAELILNIHKQNKKCKWYNTGRDSATAYANYCEPGTHKIEIKIAIKIKEWLVPTINLSRQITSFVATCADRLK